MATALFRPGDRPWLHLGLLGLTAVTTVLGYIFSIYGWWFTGAGPFPPELLINALKFSAAILAILGTHEMGHYLAARWHGVDTSLPYFIPMPPVISIGTLGAVIRIRGPIPSLKALVDIGASGPLAGLVVAVGVMVLGLREATVVEAVPLDSRFPGSASLWALLGELYRYLMAQLAETPSGPDAALGAYGTVYNEGLLLRGMARWVVGLHPGQDLLAGPLWIAGWFGLLVTTLNLFPIGQLDGGHVVYALFGRWAVWIGRLTAGGLLALTLFWSAGWLIWLLVTVKFIGFQHPPVTDPAQPLPTSRKVIAVLCLIAFVLCVVPIPFSVQRLS